MAILHIGGGFLADLRICKQSLLTGRCQPCPETVLTASYRAWLGVPDDLLYTSGHSRGGCVCRYAGRIRYYLQSSLRCSFQCWCFCSSAERVKPAPLLRNRRTAANGCMTRLQQKYTEINGCQIEHNAAPLSTQRSHGSTHRRETALRQLRRSWDTPARRLPPSTTAIGLRAARKSWKRRSRARGNGWKPQLCNR